MDFPKTLISPFGFEMQANNQKGYDAAIASGAFEVPSEQQVDQGQKRLEEAITRLLLQVRNKEFHDFATNRSAPKQDLREIFLSLAQRVVGGDFDN